MAFYAEGVQGNTWYLTGWVRILPVFKLYLGKVTLILFYKEKG